MLTYLRLLTLLYCLFFNMIMLKESFTSQLDFFARFLTVFIACFVNTIWHVHKQFNGVQLHNCYWV